MRQWITADIAFFLRPFGARAVGLLYTVEQVDVVAGALAAIPVDDQVIVDCSALERFGLRCAHDLCDGLVERLPLLRGGRRGRST